MNAKKGKDGIRFIMVEIDTSKCIRCGECVRDCVAGTLQTGADGFPHFLKEWEDCCLHCQHCLAVCPSGAVSCDGRKDSDCVPAGPLPGGAEMRNLLRQRRSIRFFRNENVSPEILSKLKESLHWSPTGCNDHRLFFSVVEDREAMDWFRGEAAKRLKILWKTGILRVIYPKSRNHVREILDGKDLIFRDAPHLIVASTPWNAPCAESDPLIALSYFDLYAQSLGLGTCWCGFAWHLFRWSGKMRKRLGLPPGYRPGAVLLFGMPDISYPRATAPLPFEIRSLF